MTEAFWESTALRLDDGIRRSDGGRTLLGGSPLRLVRLTDAGATVVDELSPERPVGPDLPRQRLARRLLDAGMAHPVPLDEPSLSIGLVVPVRDHTDDLRSLLDALEVAGELPGDAVVVDDGSVEPDLIVEAVAGRARVLRRDEPGGPGAARNTGWRALDTDLVAFLDADVLPEPGWRRVLRGHFLDPRVAAAAPRVRGRRAGSSVLDRYEEHRSPLDLGPLPGRVAPRGRVAYVPTAAIVYRRAALEGAGGFDERLRVGEDVDLVWRVVATGSTVRYVPEATVTHRNRGSWVALATQRFRYGSSAAALDRRHPGQVPPVEVDVTSLAAWASVALGGARGAAVGLATAGASTAALVPKLRGRFDDPRTEAVRLGGLGNAWAGRWLARAVLRAWLPVVLPVATVSRRVRRVLAVALVVPAALDWWERKPDLDLPRWVLASALDDTSYCAGVWQGCLRHRSWGAIRPRVSRIPGLTARERAETGVSDPLG